MLTASEARKRSEEVQVKNQIKEKLIEEATEKVKLHVMIAIEQACDRGEFHINLYPIIDELQCSGVKLVTTEIYGILYSVFKGPPYNYTVKFYEDKLKW